MLAFKRANALLYKNELNALLYKKMGEKMQVS